MIIDLILERKEGETYSAKEFYSNVTKYGAAGQEIAEALDSGENGDVQRELARYIKNCGYNPSIIDYTKSVAWL